MNYSGNVILADSSRQYSNTGVSGYFYSIGPSDSNYITSIIYDSTMVGTDQTFLQSQIIGTGDLTLILQEWGYSGGYYLDATTLTGGHWGYRYFDPEYISYSIWYLDYDSSTYSLIGYQQRDAVEQSVGNFYAPMVTPDKPGHYQIRWLYTKTTDSYGVQLNQPFTAVSRGIDGMPDYPYKAGWNPYPYGDMSGTNGALVQTMPVYEYKNPGETAVFTLQFNGPVPSPLIYNWRFNQNNLVEDGTKYSGVNTDTLIINGLVPADGGVYNCIVSETVVSTWAFLVMDPP